MSTNHELSGLEAVPSVHLGRPVQGVRQPPLRSLMCWLPGLTRAIAGLWLLQLRHRFSTALQRLNLGGSLMTGILFWQDSPLLGPLDEKLCECDAPAHPRGLQLGFDSSRFASVFIWDDSLDAKRTQTVNQLPWLWDKQSPSKDSLIKYPQVVLLLQQNLSTQLPLSDLVTHTYLEAQLLGRLSAGLVWWYV